MAMGEVAESVGSLAAGIEHQASRIEDVRRAAEQMAAAVEVAARGGERARPRPSGPAAWRPAAWRPPSGRTAR